MEHIKCHAVVSLFLFSLDHIKVAYSAAFNSRFLDSKKCRQANWECFEWSNEKIMNPLKGPRHNYSSCIKAFRTALISSKSVSSSEQYRLRGSCWRTSSAHWGKHYTITDLWWGQYEVLLTCLRSPRAMTLLIKLHIDRYLCANIFGHKTQIKTLKRLK